MAADCLAKKSIDQELGFCKLVTAPEFVAPTVIDDIAGLTLPRLFSAVSAASKLFCFCLLGTLAPLHQKRKIEVVYITNG